MIDEEATYKRFGYCSGDLKPKSNKKVVAICDDCGKIRTLRKEDYHSFCKSCCRKGEKSSIYKGKIKVTCDNCGKVIEKYPCEIKNWKYHFCNLKCRGEWRSKNYYGESNPHFGKQHTEVAKKKMREARQHQKIPKHHTKPEMIWQEIVIDKHSLPFKYTGDGSFWIGKDPGINPDFVECNGKKIAVEIFSYWHDPLKRHCKVPYSQTYEGRKKILKKYGWKLIVFWQEDLEREDAEAFVLNKLKKEKVI